MPVNSDAICRKHICSALLASVIALSNITVTQAGEPLDIRIGVDLRAVSADSSASFVQGGLGRTRFDEHHDGLRLGSAYLAARYRFNDALTLHADALSYGDGHAAAVDVTQLYLQYRPFPDGAWRWSTKLGAFYPGFSMEHRGAAWTPVYTLTPSALNAWYGEELRTIGVESELRWLGASSGYPGDVALVGGVYGWNDPVGVVVTARGWAVHDRQTGLFGYLSSPNAPQQRVHEFREIDNRPGYYLGLQWRHTDALELRAYRYDNRADPGAIKYVDYAWLTRFNALAVRVQPGEHWTFISQVLRGETYVGPQDTWGAAWNMDAWFVLGNYELGAWSWSARYEGFGTEQFKGAGSPATDDAGHALTLSALWQLADSWQLGAEWLRVTSSFAARQELALSPRQIDQQLQLSLRYQWHW